MAMPLSEELWRPTSCSCRGRSGLGGCLEVPGTASPDTWAAASPGPSCDVLAEDKDGSGHAVSRLPALTSEWLASEDELDRLRSSPETERREIGGVGAALGAGSRFGGAAGNISQGPTLPPTQAPPLPGGWCTSQLSKFRLLVEYQSFTPPAPSGIHALPPASLATALWESDVSPRKVAT